MIRSCVDCISFLTFLCFLGIMIVNIVLSSIIIHQKIKNSFKEALDHNQNQHLLLSLSTEEFFGSSPLSFGSTSYYTKDKVPHTKWKGTTLYANQLDSNYLSLLDKKSISKDNQCPEGSHQCGILDTVDNVLCLENSQQCPINDMIITNTKETPLSFSSFSNVKYIQFNENTFLHYTNEAVNNHVIAEFAISRKKPCLANNEKDCDEDKSDPRFILLDTMDESVFYSENAFENKDKKKSGTIKLYYRTYIGYDKNCKQNANFWENSNLFKKCNKIRKIIICVLSFTVVLYFLYGISFFMRRKDEFEEKNNTDCSCSCFCDCLIPLLIFISFGCLLAAEVISRKTKEIEGCSDEYFNSIIDAINSKKNKHEKYILGMHILITVFWFLSLALVCILCSNSHSRMSSPVSSPRYVPRWNVIPPPHFDLKEKKDDVVTTTAQNVSTKDDKENKQYVQPNENNKNVELKEIVINVEDSDIKMIKKITQKERIIKIIVLNDGRLLSIAKNTITL